MQINILDGGKKFEFTATGKVEGFQICKAQTKGKEFDIQIKDFEAEYDETENISKAVIDNPGKGNWEAASYTTKGESKWLLEADRFSTK